MRRGEIWTVAAGSGYGSKPRPAIIVQDDGFGTLDTVTLCLLSTDRNEARLFRVTVEPSSENHLRERNVAMVDKLVAVKRAKLGKRIGVLSDDSIKQLNQALILFLGLAR